MAINSQARAQASDDGIPFWSRHCVPVLRSLLQDIGSYTSDQQESHLRFLETYVIPNMGPSPDRSLSRSLLTPNGSPFEVSINLSDTGKPRLRFTFDPLMPKTNDLSESPLRSIAKAIGADMRWFEQLAARFFPSGEETEAIKLKMPPDTARIPRCFLAFDLDGDERQMKAYFSPLMKNMATGVDSDEASIELIKRLDPYGEALAPALDFIQRYYALSGEPAQISVIGVDCLDPGAGARIKMYANPRSNTFEAVRDHVTFGGRVNNHSTLEGLKVLRKLWHLMLGEGDDNVLDDTFSKQVIDPRSGHQGLCCSWEIRPGQSIPEVKVYVPLFQYFTSDRAIAENLEKVFDECGWEWGADEKYKSMIGRAFGNTETVSGETEARLVHSYISFNFSERKGVYMTSYLSPLIRFT